MFGASGAFSMKWLKEDHYLQEIQKLINYLKYSKNKELLMKTHGKLYMYSIFTKIYQNKRQ
jgi:hypothetical protein